MPATTLTEQTRTAWDRIATGFDTHVTDRNVELGRLALSRVPVGPGTRLLDVAAGTGALALPAARAGADVTAVDLSPEMVRLLVRRAESEGLACLTPLVMDGQDLDLGDATFDVTASQFGVMLFPDLARGIGEMARVTRPDGTVMLVVFGALPHQVEFISFFVAAVRSVLPSFEALPADSLLPPFRLADREALHRHMADAGLDEIRIETVDHAVPLSPPVPGAELVEVVANSNPIGTDLVNRLTARQRSEVTRVLDGMLGERATGDDPWLHNPVHIATATPARTRR
ncbi:MAG: methyltransferase domain-containing protein [Actinomycetota bacterium]